MKYSILLLTALLITSCGGGGGGSSSSAPAPAPTPTPTPTPTSPLGDVGTPVEEQRALATAFVENTIGPGYIAFASSAAALSTAADGFCANSATGDLAALRSQWRATMSSWQSIELVRAGASENSNRRFRIQFFPDLNNAVQTNSDQVLASSAAITETTIANTPVGAQGLPAIEYVLFELDGFGDATAGPRRCEFIQAVAENIETMSIELRADWATGGTSRNDLLNATGEFTDADGVLVAVLESFAQEAEEMADRKLKDAFTSADITQLESFRSRTSKANLINNLQSLQQMFDDGDSTTYGLRDLIDRSLTISSVGDQLSDQLVTLDTQLRMLAPELEDIVAGNAAGDLEVISDALQTVADLTIDVAVAAGVNLGFNNRDGD
jgi:predicted lipoprotein